MPGLSAYMKNKTLDFLFRGQPFTPPTDYYFALILDISQGGAEVTGAGYSRATLAASMSNFSGTQGAGTTTASSGTSGQTTNNVTISYGAPTANWGLVAQVWAYDAPTGGNLIGKATMPVAKTINSGDPAPLFPPGSLSFTLADQP